MQRVTIIGGGAWGTALATVCHGAGREVAVWAREQDVVDSINLRHENPMFLPGVQLDPSIRATGAIASAVEQAELLLVATPAEHLRAVMGEVAGQLHEGVPVVVCSKGIEQGSCLLMTEVLAEIAPLAPVAVLSGPTFAREVGRGLPAAAVIACRDAELGTRIMTGLATKSFRLAGSADPVGVQVSAAVKNVVAIAAGIAWGRRLGENARAALITQGMAEIVRLGMAKGARLETFLGLAGLGDLTLTCNSAQSRNTSLGIALGEGRALEDVLAERRSVAEGLFTAAAVVALAQGVGVEMPVCEAVDGILHGGLAADAGIDRLLDRTIGLGNLPC